MSFARGLAVRAVALAGAAAIVAGPALGQGVGPGQGGALGQPATQPAAPPPANTPPRFPSGNELERLLAQLDQEERGLVGELGGIGPKLEMVRQRMFARSRAYYRDMRAGFLPAGAGFDAIVDHAARVERMRRAIERDVAEETTLLKRSGEIQARLLKVRAERAPLDIQREAMNRARVALQEADERRAAFVRAFETSVRPEGSMAVYGADLGPLDDARAGFRSMKGRLPFPIAGRAEIRKHKATGMRGPSIELTAGSGAAVRSVAAGRVAFADRYDDYGLTVIVDHGDHYYSVYANLGGIDVKSGESLPGGSRIGTVGGERGPVVHFELRHKANAMDPGPWLGI